MHGRRLYLTTLSFLALVGCSEADPSVGSGESGSGGAGGSGAGTAGTGGGTATGSGGSGASGGGAGTAGSGGSGGTPGASGTSGSGGANGGSAGTDAAGSGGSTNGGAGGTSGSAVCSGTPDHAVAIHLIGDSTMSVYASDLYPRMGWGQPLGELFGAACATVKDWAASGRSSKSFFDEGKWTPVKDGLAAGDYVLIQFAHNDEKTDDPLRYTDPATTFKQYLTTYIEDTRAKLATPLLVTPIHRNNWTGAMIKDTHGGYPAAMRELAASLEVELVDLTALTEEYFERIGQAETTKLFLVLAPGEFPNYPDGNTDNTHLQEYGARKIGQLAMADAYAQGLTLGSYLAAVPVAP